MRHQCVPWMGWCNLSIIPGLFVVKVLKDSNTFWFATLSEFGSLGKYEMRSFRHGPNSQHQSIPVSSWCVLKTRYHGPWLPLFLEFPFDNPNSVPLKKKKKRAMHALSGLPRRQASGSEAAAAMVPRSGQPLLWPRSASQAGHAFNTWLVSWWFPFTPLKKAVSSILRHRHTLDGANPRQAPAGMDETRLGWWINHQLGVVHQSHSLSSENRFGGKRTVRLCLASLSSKKWGEPLLKGNQKGDHWQGSLSRRATRVCVRKVRTLSCATNATTPCFVPCGGPGLLWVGVLFWTCWGPLEFPSGARKPNGTAVVQSLTKHESQNRAFATFGTT